MGKSRKDKHKIGTSVRAEIGDTGQERLTGVVKWFNITKGYGFIATEHGDVFVHFSGIDDGRAKLAEGDKVSFVIVNNAKGPSAQQVRADD